MAEWLFAGQEGGGFGQLRLAGWGILHHALNEAPHSKGRAEVGTRVGVGRSGFLPQALQMMGLNPLNPSY